MDHIEKRKTWWPSFFVLGIFSLSKKTHVFKIGELNGLIPKVGAVKKYLFRC